ncbi:MAG: multiheme c-type cytochrome [Nannocystaceae bacterium]
MSRPRLAAIWLFGPALAFAAAALVGVGLTLADDDAWGPVERRRAAVVRSDTCARCHPEAHASWARTYHRTMTQEARGEAVLAPFAGEALDYLGFRATMDRGADGRPRLRIAATDAGEGAAPILDAEVVMTVGSHRYQQYLARIERGGEGEVWRLPVAWHVDEGRWIHLNGAFLEPEGTIGDADDYLRHLSRWNDNCVFCHNTAPRPGARADGSFATEVGELGIACEACHGPAGAHVERHANPMRRILAPGDRGAAPADASIADPSALSSARASEICGRCHGNRIARDLAKVLREGDGFLPGEPLAAVSRPIFADSAIGGVDGAPFAERFWPDGTPRLSAYEYQALLLSPCHQEGEGGGLGCGDCHAMHASEPAMQVRRDRPGDAACRGCHDVAAVPASHGGHSEDVGCADCHMPRITYGLVQGMISHRIAAPDPGALVGRDDQPDACTQCHVDRSRRWAAEAMAGLGLRGSPAGPAAEVEAWASRVLLDLYGGDPLQRVLAADALGRSAATAAPRERMAWLVGALEDEYPAVRFAAARALASVAEAAADAPVRAAIARFDFLGGADGRVEVVDALRGQLGPDPFAAQPERRQRLFDSQERQLLWIGE